MTEFRGPGRMSLCECSNRRCRCRRQWVASSRRHWFYSVATAVTRSQWSGLPMDLGRPMVRRDGGGGFQLGPANLNGLWGRQGQRMGQLVLAMRIVALGYVWMAWIRETAPRRHRERTTGVEAGTAGADDTELRASKEAVGNVGDASGVLGAERARERAEVWCGWWACNG